MRNTGILLTLIIIGVALFIGCRALVFEGTIIAIEEEKILVHESTVSEIKDYVDYTEEDLQNMIWFGIRNETSIVTKKGASLEFKNLEVGQIVAVNVASNTIITSSLPRIAIASKITIKK